MRFVCHCHHSLTSHCHHSLTSHFHEELCLRACTWAGVRAAAARTETDGPTPTGYMCLLSVRMLCQEVRTRVPLREMLSQCVCWVAGSKPRPGTGMQGLPWLRVSEAGKRYRLCQMARNSEEGSCLKSTPVRPSVLTHHPWQLPIRSYTVT